MTLDMMQVVIRVECSKCGSEPGELCTTIGATRLSPSKSHLARVRSYHLTAHERWEQQRREDVLLQLEHMRASPRSPA